MDVIPLDATLVKGSHGRTPTTSRPAGIISSTPHLLSDGRSPRRR
jgi:hypothetical protein